MESLSKDHGYSDASRECSAAPEGNDASDVTTTRHLRDRELLRKRKAEAQKKDSVQWILRGQNKRQRRCRRGRQGKGRQPAVEPNPDPEPVVKPSPEPEPKLDPQPELPKEAEPAPSELVLPELPIPSFVSGMQPGAAEDEVAAKSQDP
ncbi:hemogen [Phaenicophaeus curvirostris]|uniref:hemogen n=1 Tax=Phaenicophaeus curvirostris TaxID=33595 RepID=UPI0037F0EB1D